MTQSTKSERLGSLEMDVAALASYRTQIKRLPVTMRPSLNQQLADWNVLFPYEQRRLAGFLHGLASFEPAPLDALLQPLKALEVKMDIGSWKFSETGDTMENASMLARSEHYGEWRREVQRVFEAINQAADGSSPHSDGQARLMLLILPESLLIKPLETWEPWDQRGRVIKIDGDAKRICDLLIKGQPGQPGIANLLAAHRSTDSSDIWFIDAEEKLERLSSGPVPPTASSLSYEKLKPFRDHLLAEANSVPKNIEVADQTLAAIRQKNWDQWWPAGASDQVRLRSFVLNLFLSGNGAFIFSNAFVEWGASEAIRRARPRLLAARFGLRSKPKPFTGIAIFENQEKISRLPETDDPEGSAVDALILARYIWLSASRYPEKDRTCCVCISESQNSAYIIAPAETQSGWSAGHPVPPEEICHWIAKHLSS